VATAISGNVAVDTVTSGRYFGSEIQEVMQDAGRRAAGRVTLGSKGYRPKQEREESAMSDTIQVESARIPDRDRLLRELEEHGIEAKAVDELGIVVQCADGDDAASHEIFASVERTLMSVGAPFVPTKHEDVIYIRPPVG
jgi:hypothetical protein